MLAVLLRGDAGPPFARLSRPGSKPETTYISFKYSCTNWTAVAPSLTSPFSATRRARPFESRSNLVANQLSSLFVPPEAREVLVR
jgi:hypothetical protein